MAPAAPARFRLSRHSDERIGQFPFVCEDPSRRNVLCGCGAASLSLFMAALTGTASRTAAQALVLPVPELDSVSVHVVTEDYQFAVAPSRKVGNLSIEHFGWGISPDHPPDRTPASEFGLSLHVTSSRGAQTRRTLIDFGYTATALNNNLQLLGLHPAEIDALVLSHGHYDHFGGLAGFLRQNKDHLKRGLPFHVGGEDCFCARQWTAPPVKGDFGVIDRALLAETGLDATLAEGPVLVAGHGFTSGPIAGKSFEMLLSPSAMYPGMAGGNGCSPERLPEAERGPGPIPDKFRHEIATAFHLRGRGLIVLTSCSHRGVVNTVRQAQTISGVEKVHAIIGGFHLAPYPLDYVRRTVAALKEIGPDYLIPLHCTGEPFYEIAKAEMPDRLVRAYTGTRLVFSSPA